VRRNWIWKALVAGCACIAAGFLYEAYHFATFLFGAPNSVLVRWFERFASIFPNLGPVPQLLLTTWAKGVPDGLMFKGRGLAVVVHIVLAAATAGLAYGLWREEEWARKTFGVTAVLQLLLALRTVVPMLLYLLSSGPMGLRGILASEEDPGRLWVTIAGACFCGGVARLMWRWGDAPGGGGAQASKAGQRTGASAPAFSPWAEALRRSLSKWTWGMRIALATQAVAFTLLQVSLPTRFTQTAFGGYVLWLAWLAALGVTWYLLAQDEPRLGVGLGLGYAAVQILPILGVLGAPAVLFLLGFRAGWQLGLAGVSVLAVVVLLICAVRASVLLGRAPLESAGAWGLGVLLPFVATIVMLQMTRESTYPKMPARSHEVAATQSHEYEKGYAAQQMVRTIARCAFEYAEAHPQEGFPNRLEELENSGSGCVPLGPGQALDGHQFEYQATRSGSDGAGRGGAEAGAQSDGTAGGGSTSVDETNGITVSSATTGNATSVSLRSGPNDKFTARSRGEQLPQGIFSLADLQVNESGVFLRMERGQPFTFSPPLTLMNNLVGCLKRDFMVHGGYPSNLHGILGVKGDYGTPCIPGFQAKDMSVLALWTNHFSFGSYRFTYTATGKDGWYYQGFRLDARPEEYGKIALRSYFVDQNGVTHATPLNRAATAADANAECEVKMQDCGLQ
jgi:hypothetical protein